jgi:hypothetical protein
MTTNNKAVTSYLPDDVHHALIEYCTSKGLTRKDKDGNNSPSLGTAIVEVLKDYFQITSLEQSDLNQKLEDCFGTRVNDLVHDLVTRQLKELYQPQNLAVNIIQEEVKDLVQDSVHEVQNLVADIVQEEVHDLVHNSSNHDGNIEQDLVQDLVHDVSISLPGLESYSDEEILLEAQVLAIRLNVSPWQISTKKTNLKKSEFLMWLCEKDPDNLEWDFKKKQSGKGVYYYPISKSFTYEVKEELLRLMKEKKRLTNTLIF